MERRRKFFLHPAVPLPILFGIPLICTISLKGLLLSPMRTIPRMGSNKLVLYTALLPPHGTIFWQAPGDIHSRVRFMLKMDRTWWDGGKPWKAGKALQMNHDSLDGSVVRSCTQDFTISLIKNLFLPEWTTAAPSSPNGVTTPPTG